MVDTNIVNPRIETALRQDWPPFEDGFISGLSRDVESWVTQDGNLALDEMNKYLFMENINKENVGEALMTLGMIDDEKTKDSRLQMMLRGVQPNHHIYVRDGAMIGIEHMENPEALPELRKVYDKEKQGWFRDYMGKVIEHLEES